MRHAIPPLVLAVLAPLPTAAQERLQTPIRQSSLSPETAQISPLTPREASRNDRWVGLPVRDVRWSPDGSVVYFRWNQDPKTDDIDEADPWFRAARDGNWVEQVPAGEWDGIPGSSVAWNHRHDRAAWARDGAVYTWDASTGRATQVVALETPADAVRFTADGSGVDFQSGDRLYRYHLSGQLTLLAARRESGRTQ